MWNIQATGSATAVSAYITAYPADPSDLANLSATKAFLLALVAGYSPNLVQVSASGGHVGPVSQVSLSVTPLYTVPEPVRK